MSQPDVGAERRLYGLMQVLLARMAQQVPNEVPPWRGVVTQQDALDAVLQVAAVIDQISQSGQFPAEAGIHAAAMLMLIREYVQPLPHGAEPNGRDPVTPDLQELSEALRTVRESTGLSG
jgi:hypothetical protein